ncbi:MAG: T9SS type A sorting domain-containing protein [Bacteroidetes bacterium]|nr:T9SS type A sorting domain-containing protein [Bacteroidota bacterium]
MKKALPISENSMIRISAILVMFIAGLFLSGTSGQAQIYEPEGLNMPGAWNGWTNPPAANLALASYTQVPGGRVVKYSTGTARWQTIFSVAATGGDLVGGSYQWLFTSGPTTGAYNNKWSGTNVTINTLQPYTKEASANNTITITDGKWYTMNWEDAGYANTRAIFMETSAQPVDISSVSVPSGIGPGGPAVIDITLSQAPSLEELFYIRYSTDAWATSSVVTVAMSGATGNAEIPGQLAGTVVSYYAFSSTIDLITADFDLLTIKLNSNGGVNYAYTVSTPPVVITFANLQDPPSGTIEPGQPFQVFGKALIPGITGLAIPAAGLEAWIGYSNSNVDPALWTDWVPATYMMPLGGADEFITNLGPAITTTGTWYYATRFRYNGGSFLYGGYSSTGGGFWDGTANVSGVLTVQNPPVPVTRTLENIIVAVKEVVCYDATQTITLAGNGTYFEVMDAGYVTLIAGQNIIFLPGCKVHEGAILHGRITDSAHYCSWTGRSVTKEAEITGTDLVQSGAFSFRIFPNPATVSVTVNLQGVADDAQSHLELFGIRGNRLSSCTITGSGYHALPLSDLPSGMYYIRIISGVNVQTRVVVKQ